MIVVSYFRVVLWALAFQVWLSFFLLPQGGGVSAHPFIDPFSALAAVALVTFKHYSDRRFIGILVLTYFLSFGLRLAWLFTPWWNYDAGVFLALILTPLILAVVGMLPKDRLTLLRSGH